MNLYNDNDPKACAWIRELINHGHLPSGDIIERSITDISASDIHHTQCHFFAGIGGWPYSLHLAGWPEGRPVWTASCPCQPFSVAGKQLGKADARHLWPELRRLINQCRPPTILGEQVAGKAGREWFTGVRADLEALGYAVGAADLCAAGAGAPHIRQRLFWVAHTRSSKCGWRSESQREQRKPLHLADRCNTCRLPNPTSQPGSKHEQESRERADKKQDQITKHPSDIRMANPESDRQQQIEAGTLEIGGSKFKRDGRLGNPEGGGLAQRQDESGYNSQKLQTTDRTSDDACQLAHPSLPQSERFGPQQEQLPGPTTPWMGDSESDDERRNSMPSEHRERFSDRGPVSYWSEYDIIRCSDGKSRRIKPGIRPLAYGVRGRVGLLRGYGNAIVPQITSEFIQAVMQILP